MQHYFLKKDLYHWGLFFLLLLVTGVTINHLRTAGNNSSLATLNYHPGHSSVVELNHNHSTLHSQNWPRDEVHYAHLDREHRPISSSRAYLKRQNLAHATLRQRQSLLPSGWHQRFWHHQPIVNRGHLIAYSLTKGINNSGSYQVAKLTGDQDNPHNLFTQTAFSNQKVQTIYESKVRHALQQNKKVIFQAQAVFRHHELMARGVHLQAISTDRHLNFNVYLFNVQPGIRFNYANGEGVPDSHYQIPTPPGAPNFHNSSRRKLITDHSRTFHSPVSYDKLKKKIIIQN